MIFCFSGTGAFVFSLRFNTFIERILPIFRQTKFCLKKSNPQKIRPIAFVFFKKVPEKQKINLFGLTLAIYSNPLFHLNTKGFQRHLQYPYSNFKRQTIMSHIYMYIESIAGCQTCI